MWKNGGRVGIYFLSLEGRFCKRLPMYQMLHIAQMLNRTVDNFLITCCGCLVRKHTYFRDIKINTKLCMDGLLQEGWIFLPDHGLLLGAFVVHGPLE